MVDWKVHTYASLPSTQDYVKELVEEGLEEGIVVQCLEQRSGRGRHGNTWFSPMGNLYMSILLRPKCDVKQAGQLSFVAAVALSAAMDEVVDTKQHKKALKWPNDILIDGKKVSGILIEKEADGYALGMGVNIMNPPDQGVGLSQVSWEIQVAIHPFRDKVLEKLSYYYDLWQDKGFAEIRELWLSQAHGLGEPIKARLAKGDKSGVFEGLSPEGALLLKQDDGEILDINAGEVYFS